MRIQVWKLWLLPLLLFCLARSLARCRHAVAAAADVPHDLGEGSEVESTATLVEAEAAARVLRAKVSYTTAWAEDSGYQRPVELATATPRAKVTSGSRRRRG